MSATIRSSNTAKERMQAVDFVARKVLTEIGNELAVSATRLLVDKRKADPAKNPVVVSPAYKTQMGWAVNIGPRMQHLFFVHSGRRPGARMPPSDAILAWMINKGLAGPSKSSAFVIARSIGIKGIVPFKFMTEALIINRGRLMIEMKRRLQEELSRI